MKKYLLVAALYCLTLHVHAANISVIGLFPGKAVLVIDGKAPKTYSVGNQITPDVKLVDVKGDAAFFETGKKRQRIEIGDYVSQGAPSAASSVTLQATEGGHFIAQGQINGHTVRMLVDTGASMVALSAADATRMGIDYKKGQIAYVNTANGTVPAYRIKIDTVKVGDIVLNQVDGLVQESGLSFTLLGMSFLNRTEMQRSGDQMILTRRF